MRNVHAALRRLVGPKSKFEAENLNPNSPNSPSSSNVEGSNFHAPSQAATRTEAQRRWRGVPARRMPSWQGPMVTNCSRCLAPRKFWVLFRGPQVLGLNVPRAVFPSLEPWTHVGVRLVLNNPQTRIDGDSSSGCRSPDSVLAVQSLTPNSNPV